MNQNRFQPNMETKKLNVLTFFKSLFLGLVLYFIAGCEPDEPNFHLELLPFESVEFPENFQLGQTYSIPFTYFRKSTCHAHDGIQVISFLNYRTLAIQNSVFHNNDCLPLENQLYEGTFDFKVIYLNTYVFRIFKGRDENGTAIFEEIEVPVTD